MKRLRSTCLETTIYRKQSANPSFVRLAIIFVNSTNRSYHRRDDPRTTQPLPWIHKPPTFSVLARKFFRWLFTRKHQRRYLPYPDIYGCCLGLVADSPYQTLHTRFLSSQHIHCVLRALKHCRAFDESLLLWYDDALFEHCWHDVGLELMLEELVLLYVSYLLS
jgi:hypothetical protein